jgi:hypothetical protein
MGERVGRRLGINGHAATNGHAAGAAERRAGIGVPFPAPMKRAIEGMDGSTWDTFEAQALLPPAHGFGGVVVPVASVVIDDVVPRRGRRRGYMPIYTLCPLLYYLYPNRLEFEGPESSSRAAKSSGDGSYIHENIVMGRIYTKT